MIGDLSVFDNHRRFGQPQVDPGGSGVLSGNTLLDLWRHVNEQKLALVKEKNE